MPSSSRLKKIRLPVTVSAEHGSGKPWAQASVPAMERAEAWVQAREQVMAEAAAREPAEWDFAMVLA